MYYSNTKHHPITAKAWLLILSAILTLMSCGKPDAQRTEQRNAAIGLVRGGLKDYEHNRYAEAFNKYAAAYQIFESLNDSNGLFRVSVLTGMVYFETGLKDAAQESIMKARKFKTRNNDLLSQLHYYRLSAFIETEVNHDYGAACADIHKSLDLQRRYHPHDTVGYYGDLSNIAEIYMHSGQYDKAIMMLDSIEHTVPTNKLPYYSEIYFCRGKLYYLQHRYDSAYAILRNCTKFHNGNYVINNRMEAFRMLASIDSLKHDYDSYFRYDSQYQTLREKFMNNNMTYRMALMQGRHHIDMMKKESEKAATSHKLQTLSLVFSLFVYMISSIVLLLLYNRSETLKRLSVAENEKLDAECERERLEKELMELHYRQSDRLLSEVNKENVAMSLRLAASSPNENQDALMPFEKTFRQLDQEFVSHIESRFPSLTKYDVRLLCFIKVGMTSQDIIAVLNITMASLHTSRYRLRKKMKLTGEQNLDTFISSLS
jgi:tetratricopeptide (TPR) repeat protein